MAELWTRGTRPGLVYSINVPSGAAKDIKGVSVRPMGGSYLAMRGWSERKTEGGEPGAAPQLGWDQSAPEGSDTAAFNAGYVTVTPLQFDWTDRAALAELQDWPLSVE